jgi:hypothetical protein
VDDQLRHTAVKICPGLHGEENRKALRKLWQISQIVTADASNDSNGDIEIGGAPTLTLI